MRLHAGLMLFVSTVVAGPGDLALSAEDTGPVGAGSIPMASVCTLVNPCGDVNSSGTVTSSDALAVLKGAVGQQVTLVCDLDGSGGGGGLLKTGQTKCYSGAAEVDCTGTGLDGETKTGTALSYTDNGNGTITDDVTGLVWEKMDDSNLAGDAGIHDKDRTYSYSQALEKIATFNAFSFGGRTDWRVPNLRELESILNYGKSSPAVSAALHGSCTPGCKTTECSCTGDLTSTWTSTAYDDLPSYSWAVYFKDGQVTPNNRNTAFFVRAVAGGS